MAEWSFTRDRLHLHRITPVTIQRSVTLQDVSGPSAVYYKASKTSDLPWNIV